MYEIAFFWDSWFLYLMKAYLYLDLGFGGRGVVMFVIRPNFWNIPWISVGKVSEGRWDMKIVCDAMGGSFCCFFLLVTLIHVSCIWFLEWWSLFVGTSSVRRILVGVLSLSLSRFLSLSSLPFSLRLLIELIFYICLLLCRCFEVLQALEIPLLEGKHLPKCLLCFGE